MVVLPFYLHFFLSIWTIISITSSSPSLHIIWDSSSSLIAFVCDFLLFSWPLLFSPSFSPFLSFPLLFRLLLIPFYTSFAASPFRLAVLLFRSSSQMKSISLICLQLFLCVCVGPLFFSDLFAAILLFLFSADDGWESVFRSSCCPR